MAEILGRHDEFLEQDVQAPLTPDAVPSSQLSQRAATPGERVCRRDWPPMWLAIRVSVPALSDVVVEMKLVRMRAQPDGIDLLFSLVVEPGFDHVSSEHIAA